MRTVDLSLTGQRIMLSLYERGQARGLRALADAAGDHVSHICSTAMELSKLGLIAVDRGSLPYSIGLTDLGRKLVAREMESMRMSETATMMAEIRRVAPLVASVLSGRFGL